VRLRDESGASLIETTIAVAILAVVAGAVVTALGTTSRTTTAPFARDQTLALARNALVEARAAAAFDPGAVQAILGSPGAQWKTGNAQLTTTIDGGALVLTVTPAAGAGTVQMRYPVASESLPQGAIVDLHGNVIGP